MSYSFERIVIMFDDAVEPLLNADTSGVAADKHTITVNVPMVVRRFAAIVTTAIVNTTIASVQALDYRPTYGSDTNRVEIDTITLPTGTAAGKIVYCDCNYRVLPGTQLIVEHKTAGTGTPSGVLRYFIEAEYSAEVAANCANMLESA